MSGEVQFEPASHTYRVGGVVHLSVTQILKAAGLTPDYGELDPFYAERGTAVHRACEFLDKGTLDRGTVDSEVQPYLEGWEKFVREARPVILSIETKFALNGYAGTVDRVLTINGLVGVLDIKTGSPAGWHKLQTAAYALGVSGGTSTKGGRWALYLRKEGGYSLVPHEDPADYLDWGAALRLARWKRKHGIEDRRQR